MEFPFPIAAYLAAAAAGAWFFLLVRRRRPPAVGTPAIALPEPAPATDPPSTPPPAPEHVQPPGPEEVPPVVAVSPLPPMRDLIPPVDFELLADPEVEAGPAPDEAGIPRWLRPSVRASRGTGPVYRPRGG